MSTVQQNVIKYNAAISVMVDTRIAQGQHITKVHATTTTFDHAADDTVLPKDSGYELITEAWTERISVAKQHGWIGDPWVVSAAKGRKSPFLAVPVLFYKKDMMHVWPPNYWNSRQYIYVLI